MRFWTIQPREVWDLLSRGEVMRVDPAHARYEGERVWQYDWLGKALAKQTTSFRGEWPWWLYCEPPDLAADLESAGPDRGEQVCLELNLPETRAVRFPLWMWDTIFCGMYLALSRAEYEDWHRALQPVLAKDPDEWPLPKPWRERLEASWDRLLQPSPPHCWYREEEDLTMGWATDAEVAVTPTLQLGDVLDYRLFVAKPKD